MYYLKDGQKQPSAESSAVLFKPFKVPALKAPVERVQPQRKRKRVSYKDQGGDDSDSDSESRKKRKTSDANTLKDTINDSRKRYPSFKPKDFLQSVASKFTIPTMRNKSGEIIPTVMTGASLGIRPVAKIIPRPLHDPMADHAIVLYDPTIDDRETDEERKERLKLEEKAKEKKAAEARNGSQNLPNPHKSLRELLGKEELAKGVAVIRKIPVVIDPILGTKLRPHQVEGVKV
jgi:DNA repair and recombination protein RAD54 and RAD54-like protein